MEKNIQILLSTYNGERYLREQLDSYLQLIDYNRVKVLIRDDGSADGTEKILREYKEKEGFEVELGVHVGVNASYQWLIQNSDRHCLYFALSDQDDIWLPDKLQTAVVALDRCPPEKPALFASRSQIVDQTLHPLGYSLVPTRKPSFYNAMVQNVLPGHTQVFNTALRDNLACHGFLDCHVVDWWIYLVASATGNIFFHKECSVLHRQHTGNAVGYRTGALENLNRKLRYIREGKGNSVSKQLATFQTVYGQELPAEYSDELKRYFNGLGTISARLGYLCKSKVYRQTAWETFMFRLLYLLGKYDL